MASVQSEQIKALLGPQRSQRFALPVPSVTEPQPMHEIPTFRDMLTAGTIASGKPLVFGYRSDGSPKTGTWQDIFSGAIGGQSGYGKTATLRSLIAQSALQGVAFWIIDYHYPHPESLLATLGELKDAPLITSAEMAIDVPDILRAVLATIERRKLGQESCEVIKVLCIDEVLEIVKHCPLAGEVIERIGTEGRKMRVYGLFSAQSWKADRVGGSTARDNLTSKFAHRMERKQADMLLQDADQTRIVKKLHTGQALFCPHNGIAEVLTVPYCAPDDMQLVNKLVNKGANTEVNRQRVDLPVDQPGQHTKLVKPGTVDLVDQVRSTLQTGGDFTALCRSTGFDKSYISKVLNHKKPMSKNVEACFRAWLSKIVE
jgi:hypothetical protein